MVLSELMEVLSGGAIAQADIGCAVCAIAIKEADHSQPLGCYRVATKLHRRSGCESTHSLLWCMNEYSVR
jgi:hypothetical protein